MKTLIIALLGLGWMLNASAQDTKNTTIVYLSAEENHLYQMINQFRAQLNLPQLQIHVYLQNAAKKHSEWMAQQDFLNHYGPLDHETPFQRMEDEGYTHYTYAGENIACGSGDPVVTFRQWAFSPMHLSNLVNPHFHHMGIARAGTGHERCPYYWTNDFGSFSNPGDDPASVTDLNRIASAIEAVSGALDGKIVQLPSPSPSTPTTPPPALGSGSPAPEASVIQCMVPYALGKGILTFYQNTDTIIEATPNANGTYRLTLSYLQNGANTTLAPIHVNEAQVIRSPDFPLYLIFSAPGQIVGGFSIHFNTQTSQAQFVPYAPGAGSTGAILCSMKFNP